MEPYAEPVDTHTSPASQRRFHLRAPLSFPIALTSLVAVEELCVVGEALDLSAGGLSAACDAPFAMNDKLQIAFQPPGCRRIVTVARVVRRVRVDRRFQYGLRFEQISPDDQAAIAVVVVRALKADSETELQRESAPESDCVG